MSPLIGAVLGFGVGLGLLIIAAAWAGLLTTGRPVAAPRSGRRRHADRVWLRAGCAVAAAAVVGVATGWVTLVVAAVIAGWVAPSLVGLGARRRRQMARTEAVAMWAEQLRDMIRSSAGLNEAINRSATVAPDAIAPQVRALVVWAQRGDLPGALRRFAVEVDDSLADMVVNALLIAEKRAVNNLAGLLTAITVSARDAIESELRLTAARARIFRTSQLIGGIVALFTVLLVAVSGDYLAPFATLTGQLVLAGLLGLVAAAVAMMAALSRPAQTPRLLQLSNDAVDYR